MSRIITAGLDGSLESLAAAEWAAREAQRRGIALRLLHAQEEPPPNRAPLLVPENLLRKAEDILETAAAELRERHPELEITTERVTGRASTAVPEATAEDELLVLGTRGLGNLAGFLIGSVALPIVARSGIPVVLVRAGEQAADEHRPEEADPESETAPYRDVVLGVDISRPCDELLQFAFEAADRRNATLRVIHGWSVPLVGYESASAIPPVNGELAAQIAGALKDVLSPWRAKFPEVDVVEQAVVGRPARHLVDESARAGLMVVGRRLRRSPLGRHIGSVTHAVLHHSAAPVAVVPHQ
ncbi:universal stress protein [Streptomyces sodiiphilus]|uniref:Universal stress protein n=1 Tax=Streptomyces sodiiphilus TaxID=226217 RepID=A0ABP5AIB0_9ACTN